MLIARSSQEAHLYMDLHPCVCGETDFERQHRLENHDGNSVSVYEGTCPQCSRIRTFEFRMSTEHPPAPPAFGGAEPSRIIDPGEFLWMGDRISTQAAHRLLNTPHSEHRDVRPAVAYGLALFEEVAKFLPKGEDRIPEELFTSERGQATYERDPSRFTRIEINDFLERKRQILVDIDRVSPPLD
jgi:hypothetical protein